MNLAWLFKILTGRFVLFVTWPANSRASSAGDLLFSKCGGSDWILVPEGSGSDGTFTLLPRVNVSSLPGFLGLMARGKGETRSGLASAEELCSHQFNHRGDNG